MNSARGTMAPIRFLMPAAGESRLLFHLATVVAGTLLLTLAAKSKVVIGPVDLSLQTLAVFLIAATYGIRLGVATLALYLAEGAMGFPVFQGTPENGIGVAYMLGSTGGYLAGFVVAAAIVGRAADWGWGRSVLRLLAVLLLAETLLIAMGFAWLAMLIGAEKAWRFGVVPFVVSDLIKVGLTAALVPACSALLRRANR